MGVPIEGERGALAPPPSSQSGEARHVFCPPLKLPPVGRVNTGRRRRKDTKGTTPPALAARLNKNICVAGERVTSDMHV